ncbi:hypothetical protein HS088_TW13G01130 [Tripterygium wilfordii]|uniref:Uncharacterized protein n=1 Tax=Tripterygium wilfordii TaxID=458696 RepID=A0A7J7CW37_TRIWF|nr:hypothetical protein HS088_TW13G01130 [Tripterygium wilfordii]
MVGQWTLTKPSRSDEVLDPDQQLKLANQVRAQFESLAPKRPTKPSRSESDSAPSKTSADLSSLDHAIPELDKLLSLQNQSLVVFAVEGYDSVQDEFVETRYYQELKSIDQQHHTIGTGFIRMVGDEDKNRFAIQFREVNTRVVATGSNPATNDWIPSVEDDQVAK